MSIRKERPREIQCGERRNELASLFEDVRSRAIDRRAFVTRVSALLAITAGSSQAAASASPANESNSATTDSLSVEGPWPTLSAVHDHLFPTTAGAPGAKEINATAFLRTMWAEPHMDPDNRKFIINGVGWLNDIAAKRHAAVFIDLNRDQREDVLRQIEKTGAGERWISLILLYVFEALLSDPVYGGNPDRSRLAVARTSTGFPTALGEPEISKIVSADFDVCVIGSGAGGGPVALYARRSRVLCRGTRKRPMVYREEFL